MPREIGNDGRALRAAYDRLCELTNIESERFDRGVFLQVRNTAYGGF